MGNMSYCRWQNTLADVEDCAEDLFFREQEGKQPLSKDEARAQRRMMQVIKSMLEFYEDEHGEVEASY